MTPKFHTARGRLTAYSFACGYVERRVVGEVHVTLWSEPGVFHVRAHDHETHKRRFWHTFDKLGEARRFFDAAHLFLAMGYGEVTS